MLGLPTETDEDLKGIAELGQRIVNEYYKTENRPKGKAVSVSISVSTFVPKPFTPLQFEPQVTKDEILRKQEYLRSQITTKKISLSWHDSSTSFLEGVFARGDRRLGRVIRAALKKGCHFDGWDECFDLDKWLEAFEECGIEPAFYANRERSFDEVNPWDMLDYGVTKGFLICQNELAHKGITTPNCREKCAGCGANKYGEGVCFEKC